MLKLLFIFLKTKKKTHKKIELRLLTQHALALPGVVVPGLDAVLDLSRDVVGVHVLDAAVHTGPVVVLPGRRSPNHVSHLRGKGGEWWGCSHRTFKSEHSNHGRSGKAVKFSHLTNHDGERKDANKVIDELEADLKDGGGIRQAANGD